MVLKRLLGCLAVGNPYKTWSKSLTSLRPPSAQFTRGTLPVGEQESPLQHRHWAPWVKADLGDSASARAREWNKTCGKQQ